MVCPRPSWPTITEALWRHKRLSAADRSALLAEVSPASLGSEPPGWLVGITGPPGAGKSTLISSLCRDLREGGRTVAVIAVDPSSKRSGGSLLGDRARIAFDPSDRGLLIRSMAAGERLGGLARPTRDAAAALAAAFDIVVVETVGVGQSETEIAEVADTVCVVVQPGSGDTLQFIKSGIMEIPDVLGVTKADLGTIAQRARRDLNAALRSLGVKETKVVAVSSVPPATGIDSLIDAIDSHAEGSDLAAPRGHGAVLEVAAGELLRVAEHGAEPGDEGPRDGGAEQAEAEDHGQEPVPG
jgi:LAO/AO transport system kinase